MLELVVVVEDVSTVEFACHFNSVLSLLQIEEFPLLSHIIEIFKTDARSSVVVDSLEVYNGLFVVFLSLFEDQKVGFLLVRPNPA